MTDGAGLSRQPPPTRQAKYRHTARAATIIKPSDTAPARAPSRMPRAAVSGSCCGGPASREIWGDAARRSRSWVVGESSIKLELRQASVRTRAIAPVAIRNRGPTSAHGGSSSTRARRTLPCAIKHLYEASNVGVRRYVKASDTPADPDVGPRVLESPSQATLRRHPDRHLRVNRSTLIGQQR